MPVTGFADSEMVNILGYEIPAGTKKLSFSNTTLYDGYYCIPEDKALDCKFLSENFPDLCSLEIDWVKVENIEYLAEMKCLADLELDSVKGTEDLSFLKKMKDLENLELYHVKGTEDLSFLKEMKSLQTFSYYNSECKDISPIKDLKNLKSLYLHTGYDTYYDISPLGDLTKLKKLDLYVQTRDLSPLKSLTKLEDLSLRIGIRADGLEVLSGFPKLTNLYLGGVTVSDPKHLSELKNLKTLSLINCDFDPKESFSGIGELTGLEKLELYESGDDCMIVYEDFDAPSVSKLTNLRSIEIAGYDMTDCQFLKNMKDLEEITFNQNYILSLSGMENLSNLKTLSLSDNYIKDISPLKDLVQLKSLDLSSNYISDISPLKDLVQLESLNLQNNAFSDASALSELKNLKDLNISYNYSLSSGVFLNKLTKLEELNAYKTHITSWSWLKNLKKLKRLTLVSYGTVKSAMLKNLDDLTELERIDIKGNDWTRPKEAEKYLKKFQKDHPNCKIV